MDLATQILVIIVSSVLVVFLIASIILVVMIAKLIKEFRRLVSKAADLADEAAQIGEIFKDATGPLAVIKLVKNIVSNFKKTKGE